MPDNSNSNEKLLRRQKRLAAMLRLVSIVDSTALLAVLMPTLTMAAIHRAIGLGELPAERIVGYLARSTSLLYAMFGLLMLYLSFHVAKFRPVIQFFSGLFALCGVVFLGIDICESMPLWWTLGEGPLVCFIGGLIFWLCRQCEAAENEMAEKEVSTELSGSVRGAGDGKVTSDESI
jgi:hypothetical protein